MRRLSLTIIVVFALASHAAADVLWRDNDDLPIPEPEKEEDEGMTWWNDARSLSFYQVGKVADLGNVVRAVGQTIRLVGPREAANVNALEEVPDSTWFTNRHARKRLTGEELIAGAPGAAPSTSGPLTVVSGKGGEAPGFTVEDEKGDRYLVKFDPQNLSEMATGAELVSSRIVHACGWNVPAYHLLTVSPDRLALASDAEIEDEYHRKRPMKRADVEKALSQAARRPDGRYRASASLLLPGTPKGPFLVEGMRPDDPNDTIPHEDRRDLRGFRVVAAWIHHTDFRPENTLDVFLAERGRKNVGHLVHYLLDFSSTLGSADLEPKPPKFGHEYSIDPPIIAANFATLGVWVKRWEDLEIVHPALGYFSSRAFDPEDWVTDFPNAVFDRATPRDEYWGAKLVASFSDEDIRALVGAGEWSDPRAAELLSQTLIARRREIARAFLDSRSVNPADRFAVDERGLVFEDLAVTAGIVDRRRARYRHRLSDERWVISDGTVIPRQRLGGGVTIELEASHDGLRSWSPTTEVEVARGAAGELEVVRIERATR
ncbi:MAG: hypothetical protein ACREQQ_12855 [Candidatus Binatia bacterium]